MQIFSTRKHFFKVYFFLNNFNVIYSCTIRASTNETMALTADI